MKEKKMLRFNCTHESETAAKYVCGHLLGTREADYHQVFTGDARIYRLACPACAKETEIGAIPWQTVCDACFAETEAENCWDGIRGRPEVKEEPSDIAFTHRMAALPGDSFGPLRLVQPILASAGSLWIGLTIAGALVQMDLDMRTLQHITDVSASDVDLSQPMSLVCSPDGAFLCLTQTLGTVGVVIERSSGHRTFWLQRGDYHSDISPFSAAFVVRDERTLLIHATDWNRLDISDPATGELLTERSPTSYEDGEDVPPHYLDYFHGRLFLSPSRESVVDDGWVWHPFGVVRTWNVRRWLDENVWESEAGTTVRDLVCRAYFWGGPLCWVDDDTLAVWGYGDDDDCLIPAVRLFNTLTGEELGWFPGPEVASDDNRQWRDKIADFGGRLFFDQYLFAVSEKFGVSVWDYRKGMRLHADPSFVPIVYHPVTREFLTILPDGNLQLSRLTT